MIESEGDAVSERVRFDLKLLIGAATICMSHDVARGFSDRKFELIDAVFVQSRRREVLAKLAHKRTHPREFLEVTRNLELSTCDGDQTRYLLNLGCNTGEIICERLRVRKSDNRSTDSVYQLCRLELAVRPYQLNQTVFSKELTHLVLCFGHAV